METPAIHRIIEHHAAVRGDAVAIVGDRQAITYRHLNQRANLVARRLHDAGFHRGGHVTVRMPRSADLAVLLLAVLKAGGAYTWDEADGNDLAVSVARTHTDGDRARVAMNVEALFEGSPHTCANLPVVTRSSDTACVLRDADGAPAILVPHATVTSLCTHIMPAASTPWDGEAGAMDLWMVLMAGGTAVLDAEPARVAAA